jgi:hypothetical protein
MGILKGIGDFLFGKDPKIFDEKGNVRHNFSEQKWVDWDQRIRKNPNYDWREHAGVELGKPGASKAKPSPK